MCEIDSFGGLDDGEPPSRLDSKRGIDQQDDDYQLLTEKLRAQQTASDAATDAAFLEIARARQEQHFMISEYAVRHLTNVADQALAEYRTDQTIDEYDVRIERAGIILRRQVSSYTDIDEQGQYITGKSFSYFYTESRGTEAPCYRTWSHGDDRVWCSLEQDGTAPYDVAQRIEGAFPVQRKKEASRFLGRLAWFQFSR